MKIKRPLFTALIYASSLFAGGQSGFYFGEFGGIDVPKNQPVSSIYGSVESKEEKGALVGVRCGYDWKGHDTVLELEISHRNSKAHSLLNTSRGEELVFDKGRNSSTSYMVNALQDLGRTNWSLTPYWGFGLGVTHIKRQMKVNETSSSGKTSNMSNQWIVGTKYALTKKLELRGEYRYLIAGKYLRNHGFTVGLNHRF